MKLFAVLASAAVLATSCSMFNKSASTPANDGAATATVATTDGQTAGSSAGLALKNLYAAYVAGGNKLDMSNAANLLNIASLTSSISGLKTSDSAYKKSFAKGLVLGSTNLVTTNTSTTVMDKLSTIAQTVAGSEAVSTATQKANTAATSAANVAQNASAIASSVSDILSIFKK